MPSLSNKIASDRKKWLRFLLVGFWNPAGIATISDYIWAWKQESRFKIVVLNLWPGAGGALAIPATVNLKEFDGVILHPTVSYFPDNLFNLDSKLKCRFENFDGIKILVKQDEYVWAGKWPEFIEKKRFDILVTCLPANAIDTVYPRRFVGDVEVVYALPGYVPEHFRRLVSVPHAERKIDIGYRGSIQPLSLGRLGFEKRHIGAALQRALNGTDLKIDISSRWEDRLNGDSWTAFLSQSRIVPGVESGSCLFDFDGTVERWCRRFTELNKHRDPLAEDFYHDAHREFLHKFEGNVDNAAISPRHFEAAATRSIQLLYEGRYSDVLLPYKHFLPLKRDLSNLDELLDISRDERRVKLLIDAAYDEIILNDKFSYARFVEDVDDAIERRLAGKAVKSDAVQISPSNAMPTALLLMSHDPAQDPRIEWMSKGLAERGFHITEIGTYRLPDRTSGPSLQTLSDNRQRIRIDPKRHDWEFAPNPSEINRGLSIGQQHLLAIYTQMTLPDRGRVARIEAIDGDETAKERFQFFCSYVVDTNSALIEAARRTGQFDVVIAADLDVLFSAEILAKDAGAILVYDSHEYWPFNPAFCHWEREFWSQIERTMVGEADIRLTISPPLADRMKSDYGVEFTAVPNCEPLSSAITMPQRKKRDGETVFLYLGAFAPGRNLERLITNWSGTPAGAILHLRGPNWDYKSKLIDLARSTGLLGSRIFFPDPVAESELVDAAAEADVGVVPYDPALLAYKYCSPNKLSQYLAAGLPVLTTDLDFVASLVRERDAGIVFSFEGSPSLAESVRLLAQDAGHRAKLSQNARATFTGTFNWEAASAEFYAKLDVLQRTRRKSTASSADLDFSWIKTDRAMTRLALPEKKPSLRQRVLIRSPRSFRKGLRRLLPGRAAETLVRWLQKSG